MSTPRDGSLHRLALRRAQDREVSARVLRWRRSRAWKTPALWAVAILTAVLVWFARRSR